MLTILKVGVDFIDDELILNFYRKVKTLTTLIVGDDVIDDNIEF
jgi:hypothetical protein